MRIFRSSRPALVAIGLVTSILACSDSPSGPAEAPDALQLTAADVGAIDSVGQAITQANPGNASLKALVDSTLEVLSAGVEARRLAVTTNLTTKPLYFVGVHRAISRASGSFSTWTLVGFDDPSTLANLVEVSGFAENGTATPPTSVSGTIGDGSGFVNGMLLTVGNGGAVTEWRATAGSASFSSTPSTTPCPNYTGPVTLICTLETMRVRFTMNAPAGSGGEGARQASVTTEVDVPALRLLYAP